MRIVKLVLAIILILQLTACDQIQKQAEQPNIVWITSEDNSIHYMNLYSEHGAPTPNIESLAENGVVFNHAFSNAPVCSAARSTLISGIYGPRLASHYHRNLQKVAMPAGIEMYPAYLKQAGYHTTNRRKEDYNIFKSDSVWDDSSQGASWRGSKAGQPFFHVHNIHTTHESRLHFTEKDFETKETITDPENMFVQPNHPDTELFKFTNAWYHDRIMQMDEEVGAVLDKLQEDGLMESTFIFYFGDHGGVLPGSKGYILETGIHVPLVVYIPDKYKHLVNVKAGTRNDGFVSFVDFGATVLNIAGIEIPKGIDGKPFLGKNISVKELNERDETFSYADRMDEKYDMVRAVRKGKLKYIRNFQPLNFDALMNNYRYKQLAYQEWKILNEEQKLNAIQSQFFNLKQAEALYDVESDPFETNNLAEDPNYKNSLLDMRELLNEKMIGINDLSLYPEFYLIQNAFENTVAFGEEHKEEISNYLRIANLQMEDYPNASASVKENLKSSDPWERYWALTVCSSFGTDAEEMIDLVSEISENDVELINRVRAAEFLGSINAQNPADVMSSALYNSTDPNEALLILNSIVVMKDGPQKYSFDIQMDKLNEEMRNHKMITWRLMYLGVL